MRDQDTSSDNNLPPSLLANELFLPFNDGVAHKSSQTNQVISAKVGSVETVEERIV